MLVAIDSNGNKKRPQKGGNAICPFCGGIVIAACGDINVHHWRHDAATNCDPWSEPETEWHRQWKGKFPEEWREFIVTKDGEKHIADIRTASGLVIEFQNSSISNTTIQIREAFYDEMIWVLNADKFKDNFEIRSLVRTKLRENELKHSTYYSYNSSDEEELFEYDKEIAKLDQKTNSINYNIKQSENNIREYKEYMLNIENAANELLKSGYKYNVLRDFDSSLIREIKKNRTDILQVNEETNNTQKSLQQIEKLSKCNIPNHQQYRIVDFNLVSPGNFKKCKVVRTDTITTIFPEIIELTTESNFRWYSGKSKNFTLIIDLSEKTDELNIQLEQALNKKARLNEQIDGVFIKLLEELKQWLMERKKSEEFKLAQYRNEIEELKNDIEYCKKDKETRREQIKKENEELEKELESEKIKEDFHIKSTYKTKYSYYWKHRRKSWNYANAPLFLDFGSHIFEIIDDNQLKKMDNSKFIAKILKGEIG